MFTAAHILPSLVLLAGVIDDVRSRKVHNWLFLTLLAVAIVGQFALAGWSGLQAGTLGLLAALAAFLPLTLLRIIGAGDMKLMLAFGMSTHWQAVIAVVIWSVVWGAILGLIRATVAGQLPQLLMSTYLVATRKQTQAVELYKIPYTIALAFGWLTYIALARVPGGWL